MSSEATSSEANWTCAKGIVIEGHRVASGQKGDPRFPEGTLSMQIPHFLRLGMDLRPYHLATINLSMAPYRSEVVSPVATYRGLKWCPTEPAEDFSFFDCMLGLGDCKDVAKLWPGLVYYPHPDTKPEHFHSPHVLEILSEWIPGLNYGSPVALMTKPTQLLLVEDPGIL